MKMNATKETGMAVAAHRLNVWIHTNHHLGVAAWDASVTICCDPVGLALASLLVLVGKGGH